MGLRGPIGKTSAKHRAAGTYRRDRHEAGEKLLDAFVRGKPKKTDRVPKNSRWLWQLIVENFPADMLSPLDGPNIEAACIWWSRWDELVRTGEDKLALAAWRACADILKNFGMSPASRMRLKANSAPAASETEDDALELLKLVRANP